MRFLKSLRWIAFVAGLCLVVSLSYELNFYKDDNIILGIILVGILPAFVSTVLALFNKFWWLVPFGVWFFIVGIGLRSVFIILSSVIFIFAPIVRCAVYRKE